MKSELLENKPKGTYFEIAENPGDKQYIPCHLMIPVVVLEATIKNNLSSIINDQDVKIEAEYTWAMEEAAEWNKEYMTFDEIKAKGQMISLKHASDPETYPVSNYYEYIPVHVRNAEEKYKRLFFNKHVRTNANLKMEMIGLSYRIFKCNMALTSTQKIENHYKKTHLLPKGYVSLRKRETIAVNSSLEFKITDITEFQSLVPNKQTALLDKIYTHVVATGVFKEDSNRNEASLHRSRSTEFLTEMKKASLPHYYDRFKFALKNILNKDVDDGFVCTWQNIEDAMFQAVGKESKVNRLHAFNKMKPSDFHSNPLEILIADIDSKIDASLGKSSLFHKDKKGRMISPYSYSTYHKYNFILGVTEHLEGEFSQIRDYIEQEISDMFDDFKTLIDIQAFQEKLVTEFTTRNLIKIFRTKDIPQLKKQPNINTSDVTEEKKNQGKDPFKEDFDKQKITIAKDRETAKELAESFNKICNDSNKDLTIMKVPEISTMLKEKNWRLCGECLSSNCQLLQHLARVHKTQPKFLGRCKGKSVTLGEVPETLKAIQKILTYSKERKFPAKKQANGNASAIEHIPNNYSNDPFQFLEGNQDLLARNTSRQTRETTVGLNAFAVRVSNLPDITEEIMPVSRNMKESKKPKCLICGKQK